MTLSELSTITTEIHQRLGFVVDEETPTAFSLMRSTTPKRLMRAIELVADDADLLTTTDRYNRLLELLRQPALIAHR